MTIDEQGRPEAPLQADELTTLVGSSTSTAPRSRGSSTDPDWEWHSAADDAPEKLRPLWERSVERSRALLRQVLDDGGLDQPAKRPLADGQVPSLRWILVHMIEEYSRHNGHADLLRETVDGQTGEKPAVGRSNPPSDPDVSRRGRDEVAEELVVVERLGVPVHADEERS